MKKILLILFALTINVYSQEIKLLDEIVLVESQTLSFDISATDPDNDILSFNSDNLPIDSIFSSNTLTYVQLSDGTIEWYQNFKWITTTDDSGIYDIIFSVSDGDLEDSGIVRIIIIDILEVIPAAPINLSVVSP